MARSLLYKFPSLFFVVFLVILRCSLLREPGELHEMATNVVYPGKYCQKIKLSVDHFLDFENVTLPRISNVTKGVIYELDAVRRKHGLPWIQFYDRVKALCDSTFTITFSSFKVLIGRIERKKGELSKNKKHEDLEELFMQEFCSCVDLPRSETLYHTVTGIKTRSSKPSSLSALEKEKARTEELTSKLSKLSVRNVNKRIKRRDERIAESQAQAKEMDLEIKTQGKTIDKLENKLQTAHTSLHSLRQKLSRSSEKIEVKSLENAELNRQLDALETEFSSKVAELQHKIEVLVTEVELARQERDLLSERLSEVENNTIHTKRGQKFLDGVRQCCLELLSMNVATKQVEPVIRSVLRNIASFEVDALPKPSTLSGMLAEMKCIAYQQISDEVSHCDNVTLHSDGTSKFGEHYGSYQISTDSSVYSLTGSADLTLHVFKQILSDLDTVAGVGTGDTIISKIKNTMSDRHVVQKKFNTLLEDYRSQILPTIVVGWDQLLPAERDHLSSLNNFFCGMHVLVGMADTAGSTLLQWEENHFESPVGAAVTTGSHMKSEPGTVRLIRTTCKAMGRHGSEQCGVYQPFTTFLKSNNVLRNPLAPFRGNRFNILFYDAGVVFFLSTLMKKFLIDVWQTPNKLLRALLADLQVPEFLAGCKALGLINKIITGPLWRVIESKDISILDMNQRYQRLLNCVETWAKDASSFVSCEAVLYEDFLPTDDEITRLLATPSDVDSTVQEILEVVFNSLAILLNRLLEDHLPGGILDSPSEQLRTETKSVPNSNVVSERDFAKLDRLLREKPNATTMSLEGLILFCNNKTTQWLQSKSYEEREALFTKARKLAPEFKELYKKRRQQLLEDRSRILRAKQLALQQLQQKKLKEKEELTEDIILYGLWQCEAQVSESLQKFSTNSDKLKALKCQLDFRKKVLEQKAPKEIFFLSKNRRKLSVAEVTANLLTLLRSSQPFQQPSPFMASQESLVGKRICHRWKNADGSEQWYYGSILSLVPGTSDWFNVQYDEEDSVLSLNLFIDIEKGDLNIVN